MPLIGLTCPPGVPTAGNQNTIEHCLGACPHPCMLPPVLAKMWDMSVNNYHVDDYISASLISGTNCGRAVQYERFEPYYELPQRLAWPWRGTLAHLAVEGAAHIVEPYGWLQELKLGTWLDYPELAAPVFEDVELDGRMVKRFTGDYDSTGCLRIRILGTTDAYNPIRRWLGDVKTMADKKIEIVLTGSKPGQFSRQIQDEHVGQFNVYRWLLARTPIPQEIRDAFAKRGTPLKGKTFPAPTKLILQAMGMMDFPRSGLPYAYKSFDGRRSTTTIYEVEDVPVWPLHEIEQWVRPRALYWYKVLVLRLRPGPVSAERKWLCVSCKFNGEKIEGERCFPEQDRSKLGTTVKAA